MKRKLSLLLCLSCLLFCACTKKTASAPEIVPQASEAPAPVIEAMPEPASTPAPVPEPDTVSAQVLVPEAYALLGTLNRGDEVEILDTYESFYVVRAGERLGLVEQKLLRSADALVFESYAAYAGSKAKGYPDYHLHSTEGRDLSVNTELTVLDELGDLALVTAGEKKFYMPLNSISRTPVSGGGGGGHTSADGGDIPLRSQISPRYKLQSLAVFVENPGKSVGKATVLADGAELIGAIYNMSESVDVLEIGESKCRLLVNGTEMSMDRRCLLIDGESAYSSRTAYARGYIEVYSNMYLSGESRAKLECNEAVTVLGDFGDCLLIRTAGGTLGFVAPDSLNDKITYYSSAGSAEWTDPAM